MNLRPKSEKLAADHRVAKYRFILIEIDLALTFSEIALTSDDQAKAARNAEHAQRAYDAANHFLEDDGFSRSMKANVRRKMTKLKTRLSELSARTIGLARAKAP